MSRVIYDLYLFGKCVSHAVSLSSATAWVREKRSNGYASARYVVSTVRYVDRPCK